MADWIEVLDADDGDGRLAIALRRSKYVGSLGEGHIDVRLTVVAHPFSATIDDVWFPDDIEALATALAALADGSKAEHTIAGNRALELTLTGSEREDERDERFFEVGMTGPSADAPDFELTWWCAATRARLTSAAALARQRAADVR